MSDQQSEALRRSLSNLIAGSKVAYRVVQHEQVLASLPEGMRKIAASQQSGVHAHKDGALFWYPRGDGPTCELSLTRTLPLSRTERDLLSHFPEVIGGLLVDNDDKRRTRTALRIASQYSFDHLLIARFLRRSHTAQTFWTPSLIVWQLQELSFMRYEAAKCTSGFLFVSQPRDYEPLEPYALERFNVAPLLNSDFFRKPASYRYVDGKNSFYAVDNAQRIIGIVRCGQPNRYSRLARSAHEHLEPLLQTSASRTWVAYVGDNDDVNVVLRNGKHLRWLKFHWHLVERKHMITALHDHGLGSLLASDIAKCIFAASDMRMGTVILVPHDDLSLPRIAGHIDDSPLGSVLLESIRGRSIGELISTNSALGVLTSDGLTTINKSGTVTGCGEIIDLTATGIPSAGGGRTQAALAASKYGLVIKVSEDGPITLYKNGTELLRMAY